MEHRICPARLSCCRTRFKRRISRGAVQAPPLALLRKQMPSPSGCSWHAGSRRRRDPARAATDFHLTLRGPSAAPQPVCLLTSAIYAEVVCEFMNCRANHAQGSEEDLVGLWSYDWIATLELPWGDTLAAAALTSAPACSSAALRSTRRLPCALFSCHVGACYRRLPRLQPCWQPPRTAWPISGHGSPCSCSRMRARSSDSLLRSW